VTTGSFVVVVVVVVVVVGFRVVVSKVERLVLLSVLLVWEKHQMMCEIGAGPAICSLTPFITLLGSSSHPDDFFALSSPIILFILFKISHVNRTVERRKKKPLGLHYASGKLPT
jgi:hypothetical protein